MKKILTICISAIMTVGMTISVFAADPIADFPLTADNKDTVKGYEMQAIGDAKIAEVGGESAMQLATTETNQVTGVMLPKEAFATNNFENGMTISCDLYLTAFKVDWDRVFQFGNSQSQFMNCSVGFSLRTKGTSSTEVGNYGTAVDLKTLDPYYSGTNYSYLSTRLNEWFNFTVTASKDALKIYVNGVLVSNYDASATDDVLNFLKEANTFEKNYIGYSYWEADYDLQGAVKNVKLYASELTADEVTALNTRKFNEKKLETMKASIASDDVRNSLLVENTEESFFDEYGLYIIIAACAVVVVVIAVIVVVSKKKKAVNKVEEQK